LEAWLLGLCRRGNLGQEEGGNEERAAFVSSQEKMERNGGMKGRGRYDMKQTVEGEIKSC